MPKNRNEPPPALPPTCGACVRNDHEGCHATAFDADGQLQPCSCPCGGGGNAWKVE